MRIGIIGLGYVGLPLACLMAKKYAVTGFDTNAERVACINSGHDFTNDIGHEQLAAAHQRGLRAFTNIDALRECDVYIICVPTPVDEHNNPDLTPLVAASRSVGSVLGRGDTVVYESSVYPGCTEDVCVPQLEAVSGLTLNRDFSVGYSPERINPGDKTHTVEKIKKIVSGSSPQAADFVERLYDSVLLGGTCRASSIMVAEAAKVVENTQRDVNIALMNELAKVFKAMNVNMADVLRCARTKWNFVDVKPGLVGGHCISVDPYYLIRCAENHGVHPALMCEARSVNESMGTYVANDVIHQMAHQRKRIINAKILILGFAFKANCPDVRNTKVKDVRNTLLQYTDNVDVYDPWVDADTVERHYGFRPITDGIAHHEGAYDAVVLCVSHREFLSMDIESLVKPDGFVYDAMGVLSDADGYLYGTEKPRTKETKVVNLPIPHKLKEVNGGGGTKQFVCSHRD